MEILIILILIIINGFFSMSEIALVSSRPARLEAAVKTGKPGARTALNVKNSPTRFLSTVQIGITLIGLLTGIYSGENLTNDLEVWLMKFELVKPFADGAAVSLVLLIITFFSLVLGELVPKRIGLINPEGISMVLAPLMKVLALLTLPFVWLLTQTSDIIMKVLNIKPSKKSLITEEEVKAIIAEGTAGGEIQKIEQDIVARVFVLGDRKISSLMTTRDDMVSINIEDDLASVRDIIKKDTHSTYPVYQTDKDNVVGVVLLKDIFLNFHKEDFSIRNHVKPAQYMTETTSAYQVLEKFKASKLHYALVNNEYGMILGIVTLNDILQALVGDVSEFYNEDYKFEKRDDGSWLVDGQYPLAEIIMHFDIEVPLEEVENINTIGGLILDQLQSIPKPGEKIVWKTLEIEVVDLDNFKIDKVIIRKLLHP